MGGDIADTLLNDLLDLKKIFSGLDSAELAQLLTPGLAPVVSAAARRELFGVGEGRGGLPGLLWADAFEVGKLMFSCRLASHLSHSS